MRDPKILILDEATSALDEQNQHKVQEALDLVMENRSSIIIAHWLTTIENCHRLIVLENGVVAETGSFNELKRTGGVFSKISTSLNDTNYDD